MRSLTFVAVKTANRSWTRSSVCVTGLFNVSSKHKRMNVTQRSNLRFFMVLVTSELIRRLCEAIWSYFEILIIPFWFPNLDFAIFVSNNSWSCQASRKNHFCFSKTKKKKKRIWANYFEIPKALRGRSCLMPVIDFATFAFRQPSTLFKHKIF